jgi:hypothetical protein
LLKKYIQSRHAVIQKKQQKNTKKHKEHRRMVTYGGRLGPFQNDEKFYRFITKCRGQFIFSAEIVLINL